MKELSLFRVLRCQEPDVALRRRTLEEPERGPKTDVSDMMTSMNLAARLGVAVGIALLGAVGLLGAISLGPDGDQGDPATPTVTPTTAAPALADGEWFGFVSVAGAGEGLIVSFDDAQMLTGEAARQAAVDAGIIEPGEDLPNDFFIANHDETSVELAVSDGAELFVISGVDPGVELVTDIDGFESLFSGSYDGPPVYGIVPGIPIAMQIGVSGGELIEAHAVYLP